MTGENVGESPATEEGERARPRSSASRSTCSASTSTNTRAGKIDLLIGRDKEVERTIQVLCRRRKNNPLFVGEAGVGKTAIAEGAGQEDRRRRGAGRARQEHHLRARHGRAVGRHQVPRRFREAPQGGAATAEETGRRGAVHRRDSHHHRCWLPRAAPWTPRTCSSRRYPPASSCIGSTTYQEYRNIFEKDRALSRRFQKIDVTEPSVEETVEILRGLKNRFESHHGVRYTQQALRSAAELSQRYINDRYLPDKAIDVIDEAGASQQPLPLSKRKKTIGVHDIENIVSKMARIPPKTVSTSDREALKTLERDLKLVVFGQDEAIAALRDRDQARALGIGASGEADRFLSVLRPHGRGQDRGNAPVGERARLELIRFGTCPSIWSGTPCRASIGAPPGYVGFDQGGLLTEAITKHPHAVLLFDEIEKGASRTCSTCCCRSWTTGTLTDNNGRSADFRNVIIVMTTNQKRAADGAAPPWGSRNRTMPVTTCGKSKSSSARSSATVWTLSSRSSRLTIVTILHVVIKFIIELESQLEDKRVTLEVNEAARHWLAKHRPRPRHGRSSDGAVAFCKTASRTRWPTSYCSASWRAAGT